MHALAHEQALRLGAFVAVFALMAIWAMLTPPFAAPPASDPPRLDALPGSGRK
jgi:hypothetical protein